MPKIYKGICEKCSHLYKGLGRRFCSPTCAGSVKIFGLCQQCSCSFHKKAGIRTKFCSRQCSFVWKTEHLKIRRKFAPDSFDRQLSPSLKHTRLKGGCKKRNLFLCTKEEFLKWYTRTLKVCEYCGIPEEILERITDEKKAFGKRWLTIDRKDNAVGYVPENMCLACMRCNYVKSSVLTYNEMKEIGEMYIKPKWRRETALLKGVL